MSISTLLCILAAFLLTWILPVIFGVSMSRKSKGYITSVLSGLLAALVSVHMTQTSNFDSSITTMMLSATICSSIYVVTRLVCVLLCRLLSHDVAFGYGIGLGQGTFAMMLNTGFLYINNFVYGMMLFSGSLEKFLAIAGMSETQAATMVNLLRTTPGYLFLMSSFEQLISIMMCILGGITLTWYIHNQKLVVGIVLSFILDFFYRFLMLVLQHFAVASVQYMVLSLLALMASVAIYLSLIHMYKIQR